MTSSRTERSLAFAFIAISVAIGAQSPARSQAPDKADNRAGVEIRIEPASPVPAGSHLRFIVGTRKRGYLILLTVDPGGEVRQIFPSLKGETLPFGANDETNALKPGRPMAVPDPRNILGNFELFASTPGTAVAIALLSPVPVQVVGLAELPATPSDATTAVRNVFEMVKSLRVSPRNERAALAAPRWSMAAATYVIE